MSIQPRVVALLGLFALLPYGAYAAVTGELTLLMGVIGAFNILLIVGMLFVLFGPTNGGATNGHGSTAT